MADIFREVDEELRRDHLEQLWDKYGAYLIGTAVAIVAVTSAVVGWRTYSASQAEDASLEFTAAVSAAAGEDADAAAIFSELAENAPSGYAALARLRAAGALTDAGQIEDAIAAYDAIAVDSAMDDTLRELAKVKAGALLVGRTSYDDLATRLVPLANDTTAWRNMAREVLGLAAYREQKFDVADAYFDAIVADNTAPPGLRDRAHVMIALIAPHMSAAAESESTAEAETPVGEAE